MKKPAVTSLFDTFLVKAYFSASKTNNRKTK